MNKTFVVAFLALGGARLGHAQLGVAVSTTTEKIEEKLEEARREGEDGKAALDSLFDNSRGGRGGLLAVAANALGGLGKGARAVLSAKGLRVGVVPALQQIVSNLPGRKHGNLDTLQLAPDGSMYRMRKEPHAWYKFWKWFDNTKIIEQAAPGSDGGFFNKKGEFVGDWNRVMKTKASGFEVIGDKAGKNVLYTFERKGTGTEIARDGKYVTTLGGNDLREIKVGRNDKVYARYEKGRSDAIMEFDPTTKAMKQVAKVDADYKTWQEWVAERGFYHEHGHYEQGEGFYHQHDGRYEEKPGYYHDHAEYNHWHEGSREWVPGENHWHQGAQEWTVDYNHWHVTEPGHYETRVSRTGVTKFEVDSGGNVFTLFKGQVTNENNGQMLPRGNVQQFTVDGRGNIFSVADNKLAVNNDPGTEPWSSRDEVHADDQGNLYRVDDKIIRRVEVLPSQTQEQAAPAPVTGAAAK